MRMHVYDHVYRLLRHAVVTRVIPPGTRIVEEALAAQFDVSRTPVRDALRRLEADGLLERPGRGGLIVSNLTPEDVEDIFVIRETLDHTVAKLLTRRAKAIDWSEIRALASALDKIAAAGGTTSFEFMAAHEDLHVAIYRLAFTSRVASMLSERMLTLVDIAGELSYVEAESASSSGHADLVEALASGSSRRAVAAAEAHCREARLAARGRDTVA